jgi:hypothetical protein
MIIKPLGKWAKELGISTLTLKKWLIEECNLSFQTSPEHRVSLVEKCYIDRILDRRLAKPATASRPRREMDHANARAERVGSPAADSQLTANTCQ